MQIERGGGDDENADRLRRPAEAVSHRLRRMEHREAGNAIELGGGRTSVLARKPNPEGGEMVQFQVVAKTARVWGESVGGGVRSVAERERGEKFK